MPTARVIPDVEALAVDYLLAEPAVAALVDEEVDTELPGDFLKRLPRVRLFRVGGLAGANKGYIDRARLQVEAWGGTKASANDVAREALRALLEAPEAAHAGAEVTDAAQDLGLVWSPDPDTDCPRYLFGVVLTLHSTPG